jgi:hypothetical protein
MSLSAEMLAAANAIDQLNHRYEFGVSCPWTADSLRHEATVVASEEHETAHA